MFIIRISLIAICAGLLLGACAEKAGTLEPVAIPDVVIDCESAVCRSVTVPGTATAYAFFTTSPCTNADYEWGLTVSGSATVNCLSGTGCWGTITSWSASTIASTVYNICLVIDLDGNWSANGQNTDSNDSNSKLLSVSVTGRNTLMPTATWTNGGW